LDQLTAGPCLFVSEAALPTLSVSDWSAFAARRFVHTPAAFCLLCFVSEIAACNRSGLPAQHPSGSSYGLPPKVDPEKARLAAAIAQVRERARCAAPSILAVHPST